MFFSGLLCHRDDACISNPCREGSQCDTNPISGMFNCNCPPGYVGSTCNIDRDECSIGEKDEVLNTHNMQYIWPVLLSIMPLSSSSSGTNPCEHGGQCVNTDGSFTCNCVRGYAGPRCEQDVNECASNPCQNDGTCLDRIGDYTCICMPGIFLEKLDYTFPYILTHLLQAGKDAADNNLELFITKKLSERELHQGCTIIWIILFIGKKNFMWIWRSRVMVTNVMNAPSSLNHKMLKNVQLQFF